MTNSCLLLPHGVYSLLPAVLTTMGWLAALFEDTCNYALISGDIVAEISELQVPYLEVGRQAYRVPVFNVAANQWESVHTSACIAYPAEVPMDFPWKFAKGCTFLALVLGGGATFYLWISTCCRFSRGSWRWAGYEVGAASVFQMLAFVWFKTEMCQDNHCSLFSGSKADIMAASFWLLAALLIFCHYPVPKEVVEGDGIVLNNSHGSHRSASSSERRKRSPRTVQLQTSGDLSHSETGRRLVPDEEMAAGQDSQQDGNNKDLHLDDVKLT